MNPREESLYFEVAVSGCDRDNDPELMYDPRYNKTGLFTTEHDLQSDSGVLKILLNSPSFKAYSNETAKHEQYVYGWSRPTIPWKLECEEDASSSRQEALRIASAGY